MKPNQEFNKLASEKAIAKAVSSLERNGIKAIVAGNSGQAKKEALDIIPAGAEVFTATSQTAEVVSLAKEINESGKYDSVRQKLMTMDRTTQSREMAKLGAAPEFVVGSVHAVTEDGQLLIASATGSQLPAESYASEKVIFLVGTQKIVKNIQEGLRRIYEYSYPLEDVRAQKAYGMGSGVNKILIINKEVIPGRITVIFIKENLGF
ncbi:MAG: LUD domain-containing protein [Candidatus Levybacteria bacterium]|nr:LUD domain-containing protein [Candidatus Levybacteria bacterium]